MQRIVNIIKETDDDFCQSVLVGTIEGLHPNDIYERLHERYPNLTREIFDRQLMDCYRAFIQKLREEQF